MDPRMKKCLLMALVPMAAMATDYYVDNKTGCDANDGRAPDRAVATLAAASAKLRAGDVLHVVPGRKYNETLKLMRSGTAAEPIIVKGGGAVLTGLSAFPKDGWVDKGEGLFFLACNGCWGALRPRVFLGEDRMISVVCKNYKDVDETKLKPLQAIWKTEGVWFRTEAGRRPSDYDLRGYRMGGAVDNSGVMVLTSDYITIEDLTCECFPNDGFNVHGSCHGLIFRNITARYNGDDGFSVHEDVQASVYNLHSHHNDFGIQDIGASQTFFFGGLIEQNRLCGVDLYGGMRILHDVTVRDNAGGQIRIKTNALKSFGFESTNPMLCTQAYLKDVRVEGGEGEGLFVGENTRVCAMSCQIAEVDVGVQTAGGSLHLVDCMVTDCRKTVVAAGQAGDFVTRDCKFDPVPISKLLANRKKVMSLIGQPGWPRDGRGSLFARPPRSAEDFGGAVTSSWQEAELGKTDVCLMTLPSVKDLDPRHDKAVHRKMAKVAASPDYGSDGYCCAAVIGGRIPLAPSDSPATLAVCGLLSEICEEENLAVFERFETVEDKLRQHSFFRGGTDVWVNRGEDVWTVAGQMLPKDGFYARNADLEAGIVLQDGRRRAFATSPTAVFADARGGDAYTVGGVTTDGVARFVHEDDWYWTVETYRDAGPCRVRIDLSRYWPKCRPIAFVTGVTSWNLKDDVLSLDLPKGTARAEVFFKTPTRIDLQSQIDAAAANGGGRVVVPSGEWESAPIVLKSGVTLHLSEDAELYASTNISEYAAARGERVFLFADRAENIAVEGKGKLDGRGYAFNESIPLEGASQPQDLPVLMRFSRCRNIRLEDFFYTRSGAWGCHLRNNDGVVVRRVRCINHSNKTNDGIDIESSNVLIEDSDFDADDDALVIKTESDVAFPVTNIVVRNCRLASCCNALKAGSGSYGTVRDVLMENCRIERPAKDWRFRWFDYIPGVTNRLTANTALNFAVVDGGRLENLTVRNVRFEGVRVPICFRLGRRHENADGQPVYMRNVLIEDFKGSCDSTVACQITGVAGLRPERFTLRDIDITFPGGEKIPVDPVVENDTGFPGPWMFRNHIMPAYAFFLRHVDRVKFDNVTVRTVVQDARPAVCLDDCSEIDLEGLKERHTFSRERK